MLTRVIKIDVKGQPLIFELQDGVAVAPALVEFEKREWCRRHFILRNIKDQGMTAFWIDLNPSLPQVLERVFPADLSQRIIYKNQMRSLRAAREIKPQEQSINPVFTNLGKIGQTISPDMKPIKLDTNIRYLWLHNAAGEMLLGVEHIWDYVKLGKLHEELVKEVEKLKTTIINDVIMHYIEAEEKMKLDKQQLVAKKQEMSLLAKHEARRGILGLESVVGKRELKEETSMTSTKAEKKVTEATPARVHKMLKLKGGLGHASLAPIYKSDGSLVSLCGEAYMAGELAYRNRWVLTNKSGRFFLENDSEESNKKLLTANADFLTLRSSETIHIELAKNKLDPEFLWYKALHIKMDEFKGDKVKIAFNCISKVYKFNSSYTAARKIEKKLKHDEKERIFDIHFPEKDTEMTSEERFASAIVYILDAILAYEKTEAVRVGLVKQIQYMIEHQLSELLPSTRKTDLLDILRARQQELWEISQEGIIVVKELAGATNLPKFGM